jgi:hypothetical protein
VLDVWRVCVALVPRAKLKRIVGTAGLPLNHIEPLDVHVVRTVEDVEV